MNFMDHYDPNNSFNSSTVLKLIIYFSAYLIIYSILTAVLLQGQIPHINSFNVFHNHSFVNRITRDRCFIIRVACFLCVLMAAYYGISLYKYQGNFPISPILRI